MSTAERTLVRDMPDRTRVVANVVLRDDEGPLSAGFSVTGELYDPHGTWTGRAQHENGREADAGGCIHDEILRAFPKLAPVVALHLADPEGVPMHAEANALYFYRGARGDTRRGWTERYGAAERRGEAPEAHARRVACEILRVDELPAEFDDLSDVRPGGPLPMPSLLERAFREFVDAQRARWKQEADAARQLIEGITA